MDNLISLIILSESFSKLPEPEIIFDYHLSLLQFIHKKHVLPKQFLVFFFRRFHTLIVLSEEPEITYLLSLVTGTVQTESVCPCKTVYSKWFQILIV